MKIYIIAAGKVTQRYIKEGIKEFKKRIDRYCTTQIIEVQDEKAPLTLSPVQEEAVRQTEGRRLLDRVRPKCNIIALDLSGKKMTSLQFADTLNKYMISGRPDTAFLIGGSLGLCREALEKADLCLSLSDMTFPHQLARLIILEQVYRAFKIIRGEPYHK